MTLDLGILLALACAFVANLGFFYKYRGANSVAKVEVRHPLRSARALYSSKWFALGMVIATASWGLHVVALALAPMSVIQVALAAGMVFIAVMADRMFGFEVGTRQWFGLSLTAIGLVMLGLTLPAMHGTHSQFSQAAMISFEAGLFNSFTKVADITRKLYRQTNADAVMSTAVAEIGAQWKISRCVVAARKPGMVPSAVKEYHGEGVKAGDAKALSRLVTVVQDAAISQGTLTLPDALAAPELQEVREVLVELGITSLLALPLSDGQDQMGVLLLTQNTARGWHAADVVVLKTISEQIVIALTNAGLRRLVKSLSVTDEQSGLLKRASYIDLLMAETRRAVQQSTPVTVTLMQFGKSSAMLKEHGEKAVEAAMQQIGQLFAANIRQNDLAFRYEKTTIALVLGETAEKEALQAVEKLRKLLADVKLSEEIVPFSAGLAEAVVRQQFDPVDIVTEVINRADKALDAAIAQGMGRIVSLAPSVAAAAVA